MGGSSGHAFEFKIFQYILTVGNRPKIFSIPNPTNTPTSASSPAFSGHFQHFFLLLTALVCSSERLHPLPFVNCLHTCPDLPLLSVMTPHQVRHLQDQHLRNFDRGRLEELDEAHIGAVVDALDKHMELIN